MASRGTTYVIDFESPDDEPTALLPLRMEEGSAEWGRKVLNPLVDDAEALCDERPSDRAADRPRLTRPLTRPW